MWLQCATYGKEGFHFVEYLSQRSQNFSNTLAVSIAKGADLALPTGSISI